MPKLPRWAKKILKDEKSGKVITDAINIEHDKDECFILRKCLLYLKRHLNRYFVLDDETMSMICWILGHEMRQIGVLLLELIEDDKKSMFEEDLTECDPFCDGYTRVINRMLKRLRIKNVNKLERLIFNLLDQRIKNLNYRGVSDIEKNVSNLKMMFKLSDQEIELCIFLFIISAYKEAESFFDDHLNCTKFSGKKYLCNILELKQNELIDIFSGTLKRAELLEVNKWDIELADPFLSWFQNPSDRIFSEDFYFPIPNNTLPLNCHFIGNEKVKLLLGILKEKPKTSTHLLLYGSPGTGKTSFAYGLIEELGIPAYEIVREKDNKTLSRRTSIRACLNMTNTKKGSIILVDEADNILNTRFSWFMRGETQDKGWLNKLLEEPDVRMIWITNNIDNVEESVLRRFAYSLHFKPFNRRQRIQLWDNILRKNKVKRFFNRSDIECLAKQYNVSAGAIDIAVKKAIEIVPNSKREFHRSVSIALDAHLMLMHSGEKPVNKNQIEKNYSLDGLNIHGDVRAIIDQLEKFDRFLRDSDHDNILNMNLLFYGPPGTGKSEFACYIAEHLDREIIYKRYSDLQSMWVGEGEKNIKYAFAEAEAEEAILVIDEADSLLFSRDRAIRSFEISFTNEFLTQMERYKGILICTTNRLKDLDHASIRRFNHKVEFDYLKAKGNVIFYKKFFSSMVNSRIGDKTLNTLKEISNLSPGDFKTVRDRYSFYPSEDLSHERLLHALKEEANIKNIHKGNKNIGF
jgi:transitional endoplasmic reticulum ATPase